MIKKVFSLKKIALYLAVIMITYLGTSTYFAPINNPVGAVAYKWGSRGVIVTEIQRRLRAWGYYSGGLDGVYGYNTYLAVRSYQSKNGLKVDGIAGDSTLNSLGINAGQYAGGQGASTGQTTAAANVDNSNNADVMLLARLINGEARGEPYEGQVAVGAVIMNRTRDARFPSTVAGVIYQPGAFTAIVDGQIHAQMYPSSLKAARDALNGWDPSGGAVFYYNPAKTTNAWIWSRPLIKVIGSHRFCK
ncbi:spore cortex-lytic enzyme [Clostridium sp. YIM B02515]|uniref:Spore cortex-lytic enzyme n=1 Tax=Clostridium rhizosphaerae TaxID=2803861 RepID=A0ABS1TBP6_9CLOT|nr:spore cortex-lytic enzyme [Clostridium rhizosphaerae]MBL4936765.1 spore cortex-lytic enzyme [Clostridium rhizosphaerae]